jgi:phosphoserine aminotransferase
MRVLNFNAGPATLPLSALELARDELVDFGAPEHATGMSILEHSHRGKDFDAVHQEAKALMRELLAVPDTHDILFVQGGASQLFAQVPMNFLPQGMSADYVVTGAWGEKAVGEAKVVGKMLGAQVRVAATTGVATSRSADPSTGTGDGKEKAYVRVPEDAEIKPDPKAAYLHYTSNETIHGVEFHHVPNAGNVPLVCDASSDFMWKKMDVSKFSLVYAGAQKNVGPSGIVVLLAKKDFVAQGRADIPKIFQLRTVAENDSLYNTPPTFAIYLIRNVMRWLKGEGGLDAIEKRNLAKAKAVYDALDARADFYSLPVEKNSRSVMNVVFRLPSEALEEKFLAEAKRRKMVGLKGHRSVGGMRASLYNAVPLEWAHALAELITEFK